jgi:hypothetical protein
MSLVPSISEQAVAKALSSQMNLTHEMMMEYTKEKGRFSALLKQTLDLFRMSLHAPFEDRVQCYEEAMKLCKDDI